MQKVLLVLIGVLLIIFTARVFQVNGVNVLGTSVNCGPELVFGDNLIRNASFENGVSNWRMVGGNNAEIRQVERNDKSCKAAEVTGLTENWNGARQTLNGALAPGQYWASAFIKSNQTKQFKFTLKITDTTGQSEFKTLSEGQANANQWIKLEGGYFHPENSSASTIEIFVEQFPGLTPVLPNFQIDEIVFSKVEDTNWRESANQKIEQLRKGEINLKLENRFGNPVENAQVIIRQEKSEFGFGSAFNKNHLNNQTYKNTFFEIFDFEWATPENAYKWKQVERNRDQLDVNELNQMFTLFDQNNVKIRGHNLVWDRDERLPSWMLNLNESDAKAEIQERINQFVPLYSDQIQHLDVVNEMLDNQYLKNKFDSDLHNQIYKNTESAAGDIELFINEYGIIDARGRVNDLIRLVNQMESEGVDFDGIGVQGHFREAEINPALMDYYINLLGELNKPIWITEFDFESPDENIRAENLERFYRTAFANEHIDGVVMWGFWAGAHWRGADAALVDLDWNINAAGQRYLSLMDEWTTEFQGQTNASGEINLDGFYGDYEVIINWPDGTTSTETFNHTRSTTSTFRTFQNSEASACTGDHNQDGFRDAADLSIFSKNYGEENCIINLVGTSCEINEADFQVFSQNYKKSC